MDIGDIKGGVWCHRACVTTLKIKYLFAKNKKKKVNLKNNLNKIKLDVFWIESCVP